MEGQTMDSLLGSLFGDSNNDDERRAKADDFVNRVESGAPTEGFSTEEALTSYDRVARNLSPQELQDAAAQALERFSPEQRREFASMLQNKAGVGGTPTDDPRQIAQLTSQLQSQSPDGLLGLLGGGGGLDSILGGLMGGGGQSSGGGGMINDLLGGLLGGGDDRDQAPSRSSGSQQGGLGGIDLGNPIVQAILAAIAAIAMKKFMGGRDGGKETPAPAPGGGGGGLTGGGWQPKEATQRAQEAQPAPSRQTGGWKPKTASHTEADTTPERGSGLKGADAKDA
jgi:hypothetical protein